MKITKKSGYKLISSSCLGYWKSRENIIKSLTFDDPRLGNESGYSCIGVNFQIKNIILIFLVCIIISARTCSQTSMKVSDFNGKNTCYKMFIFMSFLLIYLRKESNMVDCSVGFLILLPCFSFKFSPLSSKWKIQSLETFISLHFLPFQSRVWSVSTLTLIFSVRLIIWKRILTEISLD